MKHSLLFGSLAAALCFAFACTVQELPVDTPTSSGRKILVKATQEAFSADTKLVLSESGDTFTLNWEDEGFTLFNTSDPDQQSLFSMVSCSGTTASFSGELPELEDETTTYVAVVAPASEVSITDERQYVYGQIPAVQTYVEGGIGANAFLVARQADTDAGTLEDLEFKTMNSFIGFSLKKGAAASGSSNTYDEMYVTEIQVESATGSVTLAGSFSLDIASDSWDEAYMTVKSSSKVITLDCSAAGDGKGVALSADEATDFYLTTCFGTITGGLKVTFTVSNGEGQTGKMVRYIGKNSSTVLYRNNLLKMPALTVNPTDYVDRYDEWIGDWVLNGVNVTISEIVHGSTLRLQTGAVSLTLQYNNDGTVSLYMPTNSWAGTDSDAEAYYYLYCYDSSSTYVSHSTGDYLLTWTLAENGQLATVSAAEDASYIYIGAYTISSTSWAGYISPFGSASLASNLTKAVDGNWFVSSNVSYRYYSGYFYQYSGNATYFAVPQANLDIEDEDAVKAVLDTFAANFNTYYASNDWVVYEAYDTDGRLKKYSVWSGGPFYAAYVTYVVTAPASSDYTGDYYGFALEVDLDTHELTGGYKYISLTVSS